MQVVPAARRGLLSNVKNPTELNVNVEADSAILSGFMKAAGGNVQAALKSYGGSNAFAAKVRQRVDSFRFVLERDDVNTAKASKGRMVPVSETLNPTLARSN